MENNETITPEKMTQIKAYTSGTLGFVASVLGLGFVPFFILALFFFVHASLVVAARSNVFMQKLLFGPLKLGTAGFMILAGIPAGTTFQAFVWIGVALLLVMSGCKNLYTAMRASTPPIAQGVFFRSARQQEKAVKEEDRLLADLGSLLGDDLAGETGK